MFDKEELGFISLIALEEILRNLNKQNDIDSTFF